MNIYTDLLADVCDHCRYATLQLSWRYASVEHTSYNFTAFMAAHVLFSYIPLDREASFCGAFGASELHPVIYYPKINYFSHIFLPHESFICIHGDD